MANDLTYAVLPGAARLLLQGDAAIEMATRILGCTWPMAPCTSANAENIAVLWLGPDEWLILDQSTPSAEHLRANLESGLRGVAHSLVDISQRQVGIAVAGVNAACALNAYVPLDLDIAAFPVGTCTRTVFEKCEIVLWRRADDQFYLEVGRSFVPYLTALLDLAAADLATA